MNLIVGMGGLLLAVLCCAIVLLLPAAVILAIFFKALPSFVKKSIGDFSQSTSPGLIAI